MFECCHDSPYQGENCLPLAITNFTFSIFKLFEKFKVVNLNLGFPVVLVKIMFCIMIPVIVSMHSNMVAGFVFYPVSPGLLLCLCGLTGTVINKATPTWN